MPTSQKDNSLLSSRLSKSFGPTVGLFWLAMVLASDGCNAQQPTQKTSLESASAPSASTRTPSAIRLRKVDKAGFDAWLRTQTGKVVLVDFWATWCPPCRELFPHTVQVHRQFGPKGLVVVAVSMDDPESEQEVRQFLAQQGADFENFLALGPPEPFEAFQITGGAIPYFRIYGPDGNLLRELASARQNITSDEIDKAVQEALANPNPSAASQATPSEKTSGGMDAPSTSYQQPPRSKRKRLLAFQRA
jgi:thiol-disulfide isomerase/thioredoxin